MLRNAAWAASLTVLAACGAESSSPPPGAADAAVAPDAAAPVDSGVILADASEPIDSGQAPMTIAGGDVSGSWCGLVEVTGNVNVPSGESLELCAGADVRFDPAVTLTITGTLRVQGTAAARARLSQRDPLPGRSWGGVLVGGRLEGTALEISGAGVCLNGRPSSSIELDGAWLTGCGTGFILANGGIFRRLTVLGGGTTQISGGSIEITDSTIDLQVGAFGPDCTNWSGGEGTLDHVRFTNCHCPLHINATAGPFVVTNSIFDGASVPVMIARTSGRFTHNHFVGSQSAFLDIGGSIAVDVAGNYWGGGTPTISTTNPSQFTGAADYSTAPFSDVGPR
jgi:hypothetical protein